MVGAQDKSALTGLEVPAENTPFSLLCGCVCPKHRKRGKGAACGLGDQDWFVLCLVGGNGGETRPSAAFSGDSEEDSVPGLQGQVGGGASTQGPSVQGKQVRLYLRVL